MNFTLVPGPPEQSGPIQGPPFGLDPGGSNTGGIGFGFCGKLRLSPILLPFRLITQQKGRQIALPPLGS